MEKSMLSRWNDDRLDDLAATVRRNTGRLDDVDEIRVELAEMRKDVLRGAEDAHECRTEIRALKADQANQAKVQHEERKADRRWMIGVLLTTTGLVIAALAIFFG
jgi:hypothetical protein